jgi:spermidine synthase
MRALRFDNNHFQTRIDINNPLAGHFNYVDLLFEAFLFQPQPENVLMLGLGGGSAQNLIHHYQPDLDILTVELDAAVANVAEAYFFYDRDELPVDISDARAWLQRNDSKYDMIIQDTYSSNAYGTFIPFHLATLEYWTLVKERMSDDGVLAVNVIGTVYGGEPNRVITSVYRTMREVFPQLYLFAANDVQNVVIVATVDENRLSAGELQRRASELVRSRGPEFPSDLLSGVYRFYDTVPSGLSSAIVLTDDYAPTDNLLR